MYNWSTDEEEFKKRDPEGYKIWRLIQLINYGLDGEKLSRKEVVKYWSKIKDKIDPEEKAVLEFFLWRKPYSLPPRRFFWER